MTNKNQFPDDYYMTAEEFIDILDEKEFNPAEPDERHFECDWCSVGVAYRSNPRVGMYWTDKVLDDWTPKGSYINEQRRLTPMASYCEDCSTRLLLFPCVGFMEVRAFVTLDENKIMHDPEITDVSPEDDGIPWDPKNLSEKITGLGFDENTLFAQLMGEDVSWAPENMVTFMLGVTSGEVDIRELVKYDGSLDPKLLGQARSRFDDLIKRYKREGGSNRKTFRDHMRGDK